MLLIPSFKKKTKFIPIEPLLDPADLYLPLNAYKGDMRPIVAVGDQVYKHQRVAELSGTFGINLHAPVSGTVQGVTTEEGRSYLHLRNDFKEQALPLQPMNTAGINLQDFADLLEAAGIEGAGGSRFPTHLKYRLNGKRIHTLLINAVECEPYLSADAALMLAKAAELVELLPLERDRFNK